MADSFNLPPHPGGELLVNFNVSAAQRAYVQPWYLAKRIGSESAEDFILRWAISESFCWRLRNLQTDAQDEYDTEILASETGLVSETAILISDHDTLLLTVLPSGA